MTKDKLIEKQKEYIKYLEGLRGIDACETGIRILNANYYKVYKSEIASLESELAKDVDINTPFLEILSEVLGYETPIGENDLSDDITVSEALEAMNEFAKIKQIDLRRELIEGHDIKMLLAKCTQLKQSDGEGWAIGNFIEKLINKEL